MAQPKPNPTPSPAEKPSRQGPPSSVTASFFSSASPLYISATILRAVMLFYGLWQDAHSPVKYTDIDYLVFTDAARFVSRGRSPYDRDTYRYTPLLAWMLLPTAWTTGWRIGDAACFSFGKVVFAAADLVAGWLIERVLTMRTGAARRAGREGMDPASARKFAAVWLLNPMVATISTRGSSEGLLGVLVMALLWAVLARRVSLAGLLLGVGVHFKIYPFIYAPAVVWWMDDEKLQSWGRGKKAKGAGAGRSVNTSIVCYITDFLTPARIKLAVVSLSTFFGLNILMWSFYGAPFLTHTFFHHVTRIDHRHNFSPYNTQLYLTSAFPSSSSLPFESLAFIPQLLLSCVLIPLSTAKLDLPGSMLAQTFAFVTFNKVCTSQYFLWYMVLLPLYLPNSIFLRRRASGVAALALWVAGQALWLQQGFGLEFLGQSTFAPGLWLSSLVFFLVNCWILGLILGDITGSEEGGRTASG